MCPGRSQWASFGGGRPPRHPHRHLRRFAHVLGQHQMWYSVASAWRRCTAWSLTWNTTGAWWMSWAVLGYWRRPWRLCSRCWRCPTRTCWACCERVRGAWQCRGRGVGAWWERGARASLSNVYAGVLKVRQTIEEGKVTKVHGWSMLEVDSAACEFVAGDQQPAKSYSLLSWALG